jgi:pimeloyl-ACP methyl ester carboxylesterase
VSARYALSTTHKVAVPGGSILVETVGDGPPLLLLHGWALDRRIWRAQSEELGGKFQVVTLDRRGFGRSTAPPGLEQELDDIAAVREALGLGPTLLVGMSQGGRIALHYARRYPEHLTGLVLQGAPLDGFCPEPKGEDAIPIDHYAALACSGALDQVKALWAAHPLMTVASVQARTEIECILRDFEARDLILGAPHALPPIADALDEIPLPALIVTGKLDTPWRRLVGDALAYGLPGGTRAMIPGAPHLCNLTHCHAFNRLLVGFAGMLG